MATYPPVAPTQADDAQWVALAVFTQPHGVHGRIKVKSFTDPLHDFAKHVGLSDAQGAPVKLRITGSSEGGAIVEIDGITRREQAELLRGKKIGVARSAMPKLEQPNRYYTDDLLGMAVITADGAAFGTVRAVVNYGAGDILEIDQPHQTGALFAFNHATFPVVDTLLRIITIHPPEILDGREDS